MKKLLSLLLVGSMVLGLAGCSSSAGTDSGESDTYEIALVTDVGTIDDKSFNQGSYEGIQDYANENNISYKYYKPADQTLENMLAAIDLAVTGGAKVIVCPGFLFEEAVYEAQTTYPDVNFILLDGEPHSADYSSYVTAENTTAILFQEDQAGYLAGYAAVVEGYTELGFMGGMAVPAVIRFGFGYLQGANQAAIDTGVANVNVKYTYLGGFNPTPEYQTQAASWYNGGTEVIFASAGGAGNSVFKAAEANNGLTIGVDVDQSIESDTVITSAMKNLRKAISDTLATYYDGTFPGGSTTVLDASKLGVELPMATSSFTTFTQDQYDTIYAGLVDGTTVLVPGTDQGDPTDPSELGLSNVTVDYLGQ